MRGTARGLAGAAVCVAGATAVMWVLRAHLATASVALLYLLVVFAGAVAWGMGAAVLGSVLAVLAFDFFFIPPRFTLTIAAPTDVLALAVFLAVTIVASRLATQAATQAREARQRAREAQILYDLSQAMAGAEDEREGLSVIARQAADAFGVRACAILTADPLGALQVRAWHPPAARPELSRDEEGIAAYAARAGAVVPDASGLYVPIQRGDARAGVLRLSPRPDGQPVPAAEHRLVRTFAAAAAVAIDRQRLREAATQAAILKRSDELKSALLGAVSHDLRTPLATIKAGVTALLDDHLAWDREAQRDLLSAANDEVDRLTRLIGNLLDVTRIEAGALRPDRQWYEIGELVRETVRRMEVKTPGHTIETAVPDGLALVFVDYVQIQAVLVNLIENAARYAPAGTTIRVTAAAEGGDLVLRVSDQGPGIPAGEAERIFSKFYRIGGARAGTGLGLAIVRGFVEAHGGRVWVDNPGRAGAVFAVALPLAAPPAPVGVPA